MHVCLIHRAVKRRHIGVVEKQVDRLVYKVFGLTPEEIETVEAAELVEGERVRAPDPLQRDAAPPPVSDQRRLDQVLEPEGCLLERLLLGQQ